MVCRNALKGSLDGDTGNDEGDYVPVLVRRTLAVGPGDGRVGLQCIGREPASFAGCFGPPFALR